MKTVLKVIGWILAVVVGLAVIFGVVGLFFFARRSFGFGFPGRVMNMPYRGFPNYGPRMMNPGFGFGFPFLGWLIPFGLFILLVLGVIGLFLSLRGRSVSPAAAMPAVSPAPTNVVEPMATPVVTSAVEPAPASDRVCPNCGKPVQADWMTCPYCSHSLSSS